MTSLILSLWLCATPGAGAALAQARKLSDTLRYEEAVVEYQRYLGSASERPAAERALALFELGFIHLVLGDEANALARAFEALGLDAGLSLPQSAPARQVDFLGEVRRQLSARATVAVEPAERPSLVKVRVVDPEKKVRRVLLRHSLSANGPFYSVEMRCEPELCRAELPSVEQGGSFTAWYFIEALDAAGATVASAHDARGPRQLAVVGSKAWYQSPWVWGSAGAALVAVGVVLYLLSPPPPR